MEFELGHVRGLGKRARCYGRPGLLWLRGAFGCVRGTNASIDSYTDSGPDSCANSGADAGELCRLA